MPTDNKNTSAAPHKPDLEKITLKTGNTELDALDLPAFDRGKAKDFTNLAARFPIYYSGDARTLKQGTKAYPIHGLLLGVVELPSTLEDPENPGQNKPWNGIVIQLLQPAPVREPNPEKGGDPILRVAKAGEKIILTQSKVLEGYQQAASHPTKVFEALIEMRSGKTKKGLSLWEVPNFAVDRGRPRTHEHMIASKALFEEEPHVHHALPVASAPNALPPAGGATA